MVKPRKVTTVEEALALPMAPEPYVNVTDEHGYTTRYRVPEKFYPCPMDGDQILFFTNKHGEAMQIVYGENGPMQRRFP